MTVGEASLFFALLTLACWATIATTCCLAVAMRVGFSSFATVAFATISEIGLWLASLVAAVATAGSLYYSLVAHFPPCELCWYQRICMYPLAPVLFVAAIRRDRSVWVYVVPLASFGAVISAYHAQLQAFPRERTFCSQISPCTIRYVWEVGFVSLPHMALAAFGFVIVMTLVARHDRAPHLQPGR